MKKMFVMLFAVVCSTVFALADGTTCRVYGSSNGNVATIDNPYVCSCKHNQDGTGVRVTVSLTKEADEDTSVVVKLYSGNSVVATRVVTIHKGYKSAHTFIAKPNGECFEARIADATCQ